MSSDVARRLEHILEKNSNNDCLIILDTSIFRAGLEDEFGYFSGDTTRIKKITQRNKHLRSILSESKSFIASRGVHNELLDKRDRLYGLMQDSSAVNGSLRDMENAARAYENLINSVSEYVDFAHFYPDEKQEYVAGIIRKITSQAIPLIDKKKDENGNEIPPSFIDVSQVVGGYLLAVGFGKHVINVSRDIDVWNASYQIRRCRSFHTHIGSVYGYTSFLLPNRHKHNNTRQLRVYCRNHIFSELSI